MSRTRSHVLRAAVPAAVLVAAAGLTGCGSGKTAATKDIRVNAAQGASAEVGHIAVRNVYVVPAEDSRSTASSQGSTTAYVVATIANSGDSGTEQLTGVSVNGTQATPARAEVGAAATAPAGPGSTTPSASASVSASASASASASSATPTPPSQPGAADLAIAPHHVISFGDITAGATGVHLVVTGLSDPVKNGQFAEVVFTFASAGSVTVHAPVEPTTGTTEASTPMPEVTLETTTPKAKPEG